MKNKLICCLTAGILLFAVVFMNKSEEIQNLCHRSSAVERRQRPKISTSQVNLLFANGLSEPRRDPTGIHYAEPWFRGVYQILVWI